MEKLNFESGFRGEAMKKQENLLKSVGDLRLIYLAMVSAVVLGGACDKKDAGVEALNLEMEVKMIPKAQEEISAEKTLQNHLKGENKVACGDGYCDAENGEKATCDAENGEKATCAWTENVGETWKQQLLIEGACSLQVEQNCMKDCQKFFDSEKAIFCGDEECNGIENFGNCSDCK